MDIAFPVGLDRAARPTLRLTVIALASVFAVGCGGGASAEQQQAMARIRELGGQVNYDRGGYEVSLAATPVENNDLAHLKHIANLRHLDLRSTQIDDGAIIHLQALTTLEDLQLARSRFSPDGIAKLKTALPQTNVEK